MRLVIAIALGSILLLAAPAQALEVIDKDRGYGYASTAGWSRGYGTVVFYAQYGGKADVFTSIHCANGHTFRQNWNDSGPKFRLVRSVPRRTRCTYRFSLTARNGSFITMLIGVF